MIAVGKRLAPRLLAAKPRRTAAGLLMLWVMAEPSASAERACPPPPPAVRDIALPRFYADTAGSKVDPAADAAHKVAVKPLIEFLRHVTADADRAWRRAKPEAREEAGRCALAWIAAWARAGAWLGRMETRQAEYQRKWDLAGVALTYLKVRHLASAADRQTIEPWLQAFADRARAFFDDPARKRNNHWYWLGLAEGAVALATDSDRHWQTARGIMGDAASDIAADGTLKEELARESRALHYHAFAVMPLVVLAELARTKGEDWYALGDGALHRLVAITAQGLADPTLFERRATRPQDPKTWPGAGWIQLYAARFPERRTVPVPGAPDSHRWLGGSVTVLGEALARRP
jgi:poly(beta-D-mannuronate) lyase